MGKILDAIFNGNLLVEPIEEKRTGEHQEACDQAYRLIEELSKKLNSEERELLEKAVEAIIIENQYSAADRFARGYSLGVLVMLEVFEKGKELLLTQKD